MRIGRLVHTVRRLRGAQVVGQLRHRLRSPWERPERYARGPVGGEPEGRWADGTRFLAPGAQGNGADALRAGRFAFLNREEALGWPPRDWDAPGLPKLWQYNLHYFEWLWALDYGAAREAVLDWIAGHGPAKGRVGWEPYPTSLRLMNWCAVLYGKFRAETEADHEFRQVLWPNLFAQTEWLSRRVETHLLGNHVLENGAALAFVGSCFAGEAPRTWKQQGLDILRREIPEQILRDGMHFERSPMYHVRVTYLLRLLRDTGDPKLVEVVEAPLARMREALVKLCHPDGQITLFNDSAFGIYNEPADLLESEGPARGAWALPEAGYYGYRGADGSYVIVDAGPIGPDYQPGHAHGDIFSFELSLHGQRVVVDSGVHDYETGDMRLYCRSTAAHNTVEIDGADQCEFWGAFRVARRGYPREVRWEPATDGFRLSAWHDGYRRLPGRPVHGRRIQWNAGTLTVGDWIRASRAVTAVSRLHLHPECRLISLGDREARIEYSGGAFRVAFEGDGLLSEVESFYCPEFGRREPNVALAFRARGKETETTFTVAST